MYSVIFNKRAKSQFKKLDHLLQERILNHLERIKIRPHHFVKKLAGSNYFSLRVGNYRLILDVVNKELVVVVIDIGHRRKIYKRDN